MTTQPTHADSSMQRAGQHSPARRLFALTVLLLGFAVFCWGLHDKLSLYAPPTVPPPVAKAKLLSQTEQPSAQAKASMPRQPRVVPPLLLALFVMLLAALCRPRLLCALHVRPQPTACSPPRLAPLYRRPPPSPLARPAALSRLLSFAQLA